MTTAHMHPETKCPHCGSKLDSATSVSRGDATPKPGDVSVCYVCGGLIQFSSDLGLIVLTEEERKKIPEPEMELLFKVQAMIAKQIAGY